MDSWTSGPGPREVIHLPPSRPSRNRMGRWVPPHLPEFLSLQLTEEAWAPFLGQLHRKGTPPLPRLRGLTGSHFSPGHQSPSSSQMAGLLPFLW